MKPIAFIWDLGNVFIDWNPAYVFDPLFEAEEEKKAHFFEYICTMEWNEEQDAGRPIKDATEELVKKHPEWKEYIEAYYGRWTEMLGGAIEPTVELFRELHQTGRYKHYALTNWSAELFPIALERYEFLHWFDGRLVSGEEKIRKPNPAIFQLLLDRYHLKTNEVFFIDDNLRNVQAAESMGIQSIPFTGADDLRNALSQKGLIG